MLIFTSFSQYHASMLARFQQAGGAKRGKTKPAILNLDAADGVPDAGDGKKMVADWFAELKGHYSACKTCQKKGSSMVVLCKIDKSSAHARLTTNQLMSWSEALVSAANVIIL